MIGVLPLLSLTGDTVSLINRRDATRFIGTTARNGAVDRPLVLCDTRIFRFRAAVGGAGFFIIPYEDFSFVGESVAIPVLNDLRRVIVALVFELKRCEIVERSVALILVFGEGERIPDVVHVP